MESWTGRTTATRPEWQNLPLLTTQNAYFQALHVHNNFNYAALEVSVARRLGFCKAIGPRAPKRKRRKRLAKKLRKRGGMLRARGLVQSYWAAWPEMGWLHR